ncbi:N-6 DNA methylase [Actinomadura sp. 6K520]|uniref:N-6 DNA methylase n=1 Tax=Actinomadura sp. 6K520 TaxID=2530364 RepID=UPI00104D62EE|nr:N-6 DNA methylase [Actinomadura sp. 6K520]TDE36410.1 SAM-dependent methyltransferase [Actinomadura sp. 6K520]
MTRPDTGPEEGAALVSAADIARLTGLGRAAVSNWRRRHDDFPQPAGGTANSPLFALPDVEKWLADQGRPLTLTPEERLWQLLRATTDDLRLGEVVGELGSGVFMREGGAAALPEHLASAARELREYRGAETFEYLVRRLVEAHARRVVPTPPDTASLMARLVRTDRGRVYDPACGIGNLLMAARERGASALAGQDREPYGTDIARTRLRLNGGGDVRIVQGDSLTADGFTGDRFDAALCDPPFGDRAWGYDDLADDARWMHGLPPRGEPELAWVQHVLWHLRPGGEAAVLIPAAAADRRPGRRIRAALLRTGSLRAVLAMPAGAAGGSAAAPHLWLLRRPADGDPPPKHVLMLDAAHLQAEAVVAETARYLRGDAHPDAGRTVPLIDLLDDTVDLTPARHLRAGADIRAGFEKARARFRDRLAAVNALADELGPLAEAADHGKVTVAELIQNGAIDILNPPLDMELGTGDVPVLTSKDIALGRGPSARTVRAPGLLMLRPGDVAVTQADRRSRPQVIDAEGVAAGPQVQVFRADRSRYAPHFLACALDAAALVRAASASSRSDIRRTPIPNLPIEAQHSYGAAYRRLAELSRALGELADAGEDTAALGIEGLGGGGLRPDG